jgi:hypothetical protein
MRSFRVQLDARLYQVRATGESTLVTRGTRALDSGNAAVPLGRCAVRIATYGNLMELGEGDTLRLEITNVDAPYLAPSRVPSVTRVSEVKLEVPVRQ